MDIHITGKLRYGEKMMKDPIQTVLGPKSNTPTSTAV